MREVASSAMVIVTMISVRTRSVLKTHTKTMIACIQHQYWNGEPGNPTMDNAPSPKNYFQTNCQGVTSVLLKSISTTWEKYF